MIYKVPKGASLPQWHWIDEKREIVIFQQGAKLIAASSLCPHMGAQLQPDVYGCRLQCPWHGLEFRVEEAALESNHAIYRRLTRYSVEEHDDHFIISEGAV